ncbi:hypothetical protein RN001_002509 [Aquatica leii]|uniref:Uncharacterized protein n=1 Tax=Aquatica leii TaxID=1421715 RepID=A0AAN7PHB3_9COLE|nr:hypothetical protein RN001_002509 [Aquatica leii]
MSPSPTTPLSDLIWKIIRQFLLPNSLRRFSSRIVFLSINSLRANERTVPINYRIQLQGSSAEEIDEYIISKNVANEPQEIIEEEDNNVPEEWNKHMCGSNITFEDFVTCDDEVVTAGTLILEEEILESVNNCIESDKDDDFNDEPQTSSSSVSINEAKRALTTVRSFIEQCSNIKDNVFSSLFFIENQIDLETVNCLKQKKITDFFK